MTTEFPAEMVDRALSRWPTPLADAIATLESARSLHERRDRVVEVFRVGLRISCALVLAVRRAQGPGPDHQDAQSVREGIALLRRRGLTDGQWLGLAREVLRPWAEQPELHRLPLLVQAFHGRNKAFRKACEGLLAMRKAETVAHGTAGDEAELEEVLARRLPQLLTVLQTLEPLWAEQEWVMPTASRALRLVGGSPSRGRWRPVQLAQPATEGELLAVTTDGAPLLALHPWLRFMRPSPGAVEEVFFLDGSVRKKARYLALPSTAEHREADVWEGLADLVSATQGPDGGPEGLERPYLGLRSFQAEHAALFFGREQQSAALANRIRREPLLTVTGASGAGKSSLMQAGVLPRLADKEVVSARPGTHPYRALRTALAGHVDDETLLGTSELAMDGSLVVLVDQVEEVFTQCEDPARRERWARAVRRLADGGGHVVLSLREDFFARLATLPPLAGRYHRAVEVVAPPGRGDLLRCLVSPAQAFGYTFEPGLPEEMVAAVASEASALALLQFCADQLWEQRDRSFRTLTREGYRTVGGVEGALAAHAERWFDALPPHQQSLARGLFRRLVTPARTRAALAPSELPRDAGREVLDALVSARLVHLRDGDEGPLAELVHEALIEHWERLGAWLDEDRVHNRMLHAVRHAAVDWQERGRPDGLLWTGDSFAELQRWWGQLTQPLAEREAAFVEACLDLAARLREEAAQAQLRRQRGLRLAALVATVLAAGFAVLAALAVQARDVAAQERTVAAAEALRARDATRLAAARAAEEDPTLQLALLRELEAPQASPSWQAEAYGVLANNVVARWVGSDASRGAILVQGGDALVTADGADIFRVPLDAASEPVLLGRHAADITWIESLPGGHRWVTSAEDGAVWLWDATGEVVKTLAVGEPVRAISSAPDASAVLVTVADGMQWWSFTDDRHYPLEPEGRFGAVWSADGQRMATWTGTTLTVRDGFGEALTELVGHTRPIVGAGFDPGAERLLSAAYDKTGRVWDLSGEREPVIVAGDHRLMRGPVVDPLGREFALPSGSAEVARFTWDGEPLPPLVGHESSPTMTSYSPDGTQIVTVSLDRTARLWSVEQASAQVLRGHAAGLIGAEVLGDTVLTADTRGELRTWPARPSNSRTLHHRSSPEQGPDDVVGMAVGPNGRWAASYTLAGALVLHDLQQGDRYALVGHTDQIFDMAFTPDGTALVTASRDRTARRWSLTSPGESVRSDQHEQAVTGISFTEEGVLTSSAAGGFFRGDGALWLHPHDGSASRALPTPPAYAAVLPVPRSERLALLSKDFSVRLRGLEEEGAGEELGRHSDGFTSWLMDPDGAWLATASFKGELVIWSLEGGEHVHLDPGGQVQRIALSPDERWLMTVSSGGVRLFDLEGTEPTRVLMDGAAGYSLDFSPNSRFAATIRDDQIQIRDLDGIGPPLVLEATMPLTKVRFSADGTRVFALARRIGLLSIPFDPTLFTDADALLASMWSASRFCPSVAQRQELLGLDATSAEAALARCRERVGASAPGPSGTAAAP